MKIILQENWDDTPSGKNKPSKYFSGRNKELEQLKNIIENKNSGSILIAASRGTGKTDLVYKAVTEAKQDDDRVILPIVFNANHFSKDKNDKDLIILKSLINRTYSTFTNLTNPNKELLNEINRLYLQATSSSYQELLETVNSNNRNNKNKFSVRDKNSSVISLDTDRLKALLKAVYPYLILGIVLSQIDFLLKVILIIFILLLVYLTRVEIKSTHEELESDEHIKSISESELAKLIYVKDGSLGNLESGLKHFLSLAEKKYKFVFIIDELDKLDENPKVVLETIKSFKGLFNHSDALFLFIADEQVFSEINARRSVRAIESTLFSQRIFISKPTIEDIKDYLTKIISKGDQQIKEEFKDYVVYESRMDFYYIADVVRDLISAYEEKKPVINWEEKHQDSETKLKINKQKVIQAILRDGKYLYKQQSINNKNTDLINAAYEIAELKTNIVIDPNRSIIDSHEKLIAQLQADLAHYLTLSGVFSRKDSASPDGLILDEYSPTGLIGTPITDLTVPLAYEQELIDKFNEFNNFLFNSYNFYANITQSKISEKLDTHTITKLIDLIGLSSTIYERANEAYKNLHKTPLKHDIGQEDIRSIVDEFMNHQEELKRNRDQDLFIKIMQKLNIPILDIKSLDDLTGIEQLKAFIVNNAIKNLVLINKNKSKYLLIIFNSSGSFSSIAHQNKELYDEILKTRNVQILEILAESEKVKISEPIKKIRVLTLKETVSNHKLIKDFIIDYFYEKDVDNT